MVRNSRYSTHTAVRISTSAQTSRSKVVEFRDKPVPMRGKQFFYDLEEEVRKLEQEKRMLAMELGFAKSASTIYRPPPTRKPPSSI